jgi:hypothetical protein
MKSFWSKLGLCQTCMSLSAAFLALSLLVLGLGRNIDQPVLILIGQLASIAFGILVALHTIFYFARRGKRIAQSHAGHAADTSRHSSFVVSNRGCGWCGGRR